MVILIVGIVIVVVVVAVTLVTGHLAKASPASVGPHYDDIEHHHPRLQDEDPPTA